VRKLERALIDLECGLPGDDLPLELEALNIREDARKEISRASIFTAVQVLKKCRLDYSFSHQNYSDFACNYSSI